MPEDRFFIKKKQIYAELQHKETAIIEAIFLEMPDKKDTMLTIAKQNRSSNYKPNLSEDENLQNPIFKAAFRNAVKKQFPERSEALNKFYQPKIKSINTALPLI